MKNAVQITTLDNGFRIISENIAGFESAVVGVWAGVGARFETPAQNGIAHFLEHMAFKGTTSRTSLQIAESIENVGGYMNAYTGRETTAYYARVLRADTGLALDITSDIVLNAIFDARELELERGVILSEIGQMHDTPDDVIFEWLQELTYPNQPMGRGILGTAERVSAYSADDLRGFVRQHYHPASLVLSAAGAVDHDALVKQAQGVFADLPAGVMASADPAKYGGGDRREIKDLEQAHFALSLPSVGYKDDAIYTAQIYSMILGGGMSSRLFQELREKRGMCYTIYASQNSYADGGVLTIYSGTSGDDIAELPLLCCDEIRRMTDTITAEELARARAQFKAGMMMGQESTMARCDRNARMLQIWGRVPPLAEISAKLDAVSLEGIRDFGGRFTGGVVPSCSLYGPVSAAPDYGILSDRLQRG